MISIWVVLGILFTHLIADFFLQSDWMAINKSTRWDALMLHVGVYALCFLPFGFLFACATFLFHFGTDAITSRITSYLWGKQQRHWFFVVIGIDQFIHYVTLLWTYMALSSAIKCF
jgi:hypothetical protein